MTRLRMTRRQFQTALGVSLATAACPAWGAAERTPGFRLNYILGSPMYGTAPLAEVLPEVKKTGATHLDLWPRPHANHREQAAELGLDHFAELLREHGVGLGVITRYDLGPYRLQDEMRVLKQLGGRLIVTGAKNADGDTLRERVKAFVASLRPHVEVAEALGVAIGIENHANSLVHEPDSLRYFAEFAASPHLGIALAPYHLPQDEDLIAGIIADLDKHLLFFQGWQHGMGCMTKLPKDQELLQLPGRGPLDFTPLLRALKRIDYQGFTEIFMHPVPRGIPILETTAAVTDEINRARAYLDACLAKA